MDNTTQTKKSTYNADAQKKYNQKFKFITTKIEKEKATAIENHLKEKGYKSFNSYIISLIDADMKQ